MKPPVIAIRWVVPLYAAIGLGILVLLLSAGFWGKPLIALGVWGLGGALLIFPLSVRVDSSGVSALGWGGRKFLAWENVEDVQFQGHVISLAGQAVRLRLSVAFFEDADRTIEYVAAHIPHALREKL